MIETIAPRLEKYGLVCKNVLEAGPSFPKTLSMILSLRPGDRNVSGVFGTNEVKLSVVSISEAYAAFYVGNMQSTEVNVYYSKTSVKSYFLCLRW